MISHCFEKIAASDDGSFILPLHEAATRGGEGERKGRMWGEKKGRRRRDEGRMQELQ